MRKCGSGVQCSPKSLYAQSLSWRSPSPSPSSLTCLLADNFRSHVWHEPDGELADHFPRNHGLGPRPRKGTFNPMEGEGRVPPSVHQDVFLQKTTKRVRGQHRLLTKETAMAPAKFFLVAAAWGLHSHRQAVQTLEG